MILIGSSTGGPGHIEKIISSLNRLDIICPIVFAQHMEEGYVDSFVKRLKNGSKFDVKIASGELLNNTIYVCKSTVVLKEQKNGIHNSIYFENSFAKSFYNPTIDTLFLSAQYLKIKIGAFILTGIGNDGAKGASTLKDVGFEVYAESQKSAVVYGMPKSAIENNSKIESLALEDIILKIRGFNV